VPAPFQVPRKPPSVFITSPLDGWVLRPDLPVVLRGYGYDQLFNDLPADALRWSSDRNGDLGSGEIVEVSLSPGWHTITLTARDGAGLTTRDTIRIYVGYLSWIPIVKQR